MMCQRIGRPPISTIGFGVRSVSSASACRARRRGSPPSSGQVSPAGEAITKMTIELRNLTIPSGERRRPCASLSVGAPERAATGQAACAPPLAFRLGPSGLAAAGAARRRGDPCRSRARKTAAHCSKTRSTLPRSTAARLVPRSAQSEPPPRASRAGRGNATMPTAKAEPFPGKPGEHKVHRCHSRRAAIAAPTTERTGTSMTGQQEVDHPPIATPR